MSENYIAAQAFRFGDELLQPGDAVPMEEGRRYDLMEAAGQIVKSGAVKVPEEKSGNLPEDFPGLKALTDAGYTTYESLKPLFVTALQTVKGVGEKTAQEIHGAL